MYLVGSGESIIKAMRVHHPFVAQLSVPRSALHLCVYLLLRSTQELTLLAGLKLSRNNTHNFLAHTYVENRSLFCVGDHRRILPSFPPSKLWPMISRSLLTTLQHFLACVHNRYTCTFTLCVGVYIINFLQTPVIGLLLTVVQSKP